MLLFESPSAAKEAYPTAEREFHRSKTEDKEFRQGLLEKYPNARKVLKPSEREVVRSMYKAIKNNEWASEALSSGGTTQDVLIGKFPGFGLKVKAKLDMTSPSGVCIADLKSTWHSNEDSFKNSVIDYGYHIQAAWYSDLHTVLTDICPSFVFLCVSSSEPHNVWVTTLPPYLIAAGRKHYEDLIRLYIRNTEGGK